MLLKSSVVLLTIIGLIHCDVIDYKKANSILGRQNRKLTVSHRTHHTSFISFMKKYEKVYESETELMTRLHNFNENAKKYEEIQAKDIGTAKYGVSPFSDYSEEEVSFYTSGLKLKGRSPRNLPSDSYSKGFLDFKAESYPTAFDWRAKNVVAPVKKQGRCGSCWAFSVVGCIEGQYAIKNKKVVELSEQQLVDCDYYDDGCRGGYMSDAYQYLIEEGGIETERDYPYIGKRRYERECDFDL